jgi:hypothetical protein
MKLCEGGAWNTCNFSPYNKQSSNILIFRVNPRLNFLYFYTKNTVGRILASSQRITSGTKTAIMVTFLPALLVLLLSVK